MNFKIYGPYLKAEGAAGAGGGGADGDMSELEQDLADIGDAEDTPDGEGDNSEDDGDGSDDGGEDSEGDSEDSEEDGSEDTEESEGEADEDTEGDDETEEGKEEVDTETGRPTVKALKAALGKDVFKKFPYLKAAYFGYEKLREVFSDPEAANLAARKASEYDDLENALVGQGDPQILLETLSENNPKALAKVVQNFGPKLREVDPKLYLELSTPIVEEALYHAAASARKSGNKNLMLAVKHIANWAFGSSDVPDITRRANQGPSEEEVALSRDRQKFDQEKFQTASGEVIDSVSPVLDMIIKGKDKLKGLTKFESAQVIKETRARVGESLRNDAAFQRTMDSLWAQARKSGYSGDSKERIKKAWLSRAREIAPGIRNKIKQEALAGRNGSGKGEQNTTGKKKRTFPAEAGRPGRGQGSGVLNPSKIDWSKTSDVDILSGDSNRVTLKR